MIRHAKALAVLACGAFAPAVWAADALTGEVHKQPLNVSAIAMFVAFVAFTLGITYWASKRNKSAADYYAAGGRSPASRTAWRLPATTCRRPRSWGFPRWCSPPATTA